MNFSWNLSEGEKGEGRRGGDGERGRERLGKYK
jgi:hypothetical protein